MNGGLIEWSVANLPPIKEQKSKRAKEQKGNKPRAKSILNGGLIEWSVANLPPIKEQKSKRETSQELSQS